jgi:hypothetical protein
MSMYDPMVEVDIWGHYIDIAIAIAILTLLTIHSYSYVDVDVDIDVFSYTSSIEVDPSGVVFNTPKILGLSIEYRLSSKL